MATKDDQEAVEASAKSLGFTRTPDGFYFHPEIGYVPPSTIAFIKQALQHQRIQDLEQIKAEPVDDPIREVKNLLGIPEWCDGYRAGLKAYDAAIDKVFKGKES